MLDFISLFCGCGGFDIGLQKAGFQPLLAVDNDSSAIQAYKHSIGANVVSEDLRNSSPYDTFLSSRPALVTAGPPCQGFSTAGKGNSDDPRNDLLIVAIDHILRIKPEALILENVPGIKSPKNRSYWNSAKGRLAEFGYSLVELDIDVTNIGMAQSRRRVVLVGVLRQIDTHAFQLPSKPSQKLRDVITKTGFPMQNSIEVLQPTSREKKIAAAIPPGKKLSNSRAGEKSIHTWNIPEVFGSTTRRERTILNWMIKARRRCRRRSIGDADPVTFERLRAEFGSSNLENELDSLIARNFLRKRDGDYDLTNTFNGKYRRLEMDSVSPTVHTKFGEPRYFLHPKRDGGFSLEEAMVLQGFPDNYTWPEIAIRTKFKLIGNAVPPPLAFTIGKTLKKVLEQ